MAIPNQLLTLAPVACAILESIDGKRLRDNELLVLNPRPVKPRIGWLYFSIILRELSGETSRSPLVTGIVSGGGRGVKPWFECRTYPVVEFDNSSCDARAESLEAGVIQVLADQIPPGGHLMLDYENAGHENTFAELILRVPPVASYLGSLMFRAGCRGDFKDWYFSEGGHEGPRKLQANKSPDRKSELRSIRQHVSDLTKFIARRPPSDPEQAGVIRTAQDRARELLNEIKRGSRAARKARPTRRATRPRL